VHPNKTKHRIPLPADTHHYETRSKGKLNQPLVSPQIALLGTAVNPDTGKIAKYKELSKCSEGPLWQASNAKEIGCLRQGFGSVKGTDTMFFIPHTSIPKNKKATYLHVVAAFCPEKTNPRWIWWTFGGDRIFYVADVNTNTADLTTAKILFNSVLSTPGAKFLRIDIKDFYLGTPMKDFEYMHIPLHMIPEAIIGQYNLTPLVHNNCVYVQIRKGMYGLPQAGKLVNNLLLEALAPLGIVLSPSHLAYGGMKQETSPFV
jgi:hypothetical protein